MDQRHVHIDIESKSPVNLKTDGVYNYATHPDTDVLCICYAIDNGPVKLWEPRKLFPTELQNALEDSICWAHNAAFERLMFEHVILPKYGRACTPEWRCTAVLSRAYGLPSALGDVARFIGLPAQKSHAGQALIRKMCIPDKHGHFQWSENLLAEMLDYCVQDVQVERMIYLTLPDVVDWSAYAMSERINDRGILVDVGFAARAASFAEAEKADIKLQFNKLTGFNSPGSTSYTTHLHQKLLAHSNEAHNLAHWMSSLRLKDGEMVEKLSLAGDIVEALLERSADLPADVVTALELKQRYSRSSSAKFATMVARAGPDGRVRGSYLFLGASKTGRYSARGLQMHNMPRDTVDDPESYIVDGEPLSLEVLPALIRPSLYAPKGTTYVCSDWAGIEARALPWLSDMKLRNRGVINLLALFRRGGDVYVEAATDIYKVEHSEVTKVQRQVGKVAVLSLGYGGSLGAFKSMAAGYGVELEDEVIENVVASWRENNAWATRFWKQLVAAAIAAVTVPGSIHWSGRVYWVMEVTCSIAPCHQAGASLTHRQGLKHPQKHGWALSCLH